MHSEQKLFLSLNIIFVALVIANFFKFVSLDKKSKFAQNEEGFEQEDVDEEEFENEDLDEHNKASDNHQAKDGTTSFQSWMGTQGLNFDMF